jgi:5-methylcytosine-specific restriction endonuclease McrA
MPQKTDLSKEVYILSLNNLIAERNSFKKYHAIIEKKCSAHRAELNSNSKKLSEIENELIDNLLELQKMIYDFFKKYSLCINEINQDLIEKEDHLLLFHIESVNVKGKFFIPLAFISDEPNEEISRKFGLLFQSYAHLNCFGYIGYEKIGSIERPEKLNNVFTKQQIIDCLNQKNIIELKIDLGGWLHYPILCGKAIWKLTSRETFLSKEEKKFIIFEKNEKEKRKFERLKFKHEGTKNKRERISEDVKMFVWRRDQGKCVECGGQEKLEFDHIIPVSKGGSNTARNLQLLCENCNRTKSDKI